MSSETQAALISAVGEMIVEDKAMQRAPWQSLALAVTLDNDGNEEMSGYRYLEDGSFEAGSPDEFGDILDKLLELKAEMAADGDGSFQQCLIHIIKPEYKIRIQFEFDNPKRWWPKTVGVDMSEFAEALRPR